MYESINEIFGENINGYFWLVLLMSWIFISKIELNNSNIKIKMSLIYIIFFLIALFDIFDLKIICLIFVIFTFVFLEFIYADEFKKDILKKPCYLILDYLYIMMFEYKVLYFALSLLLLSNTFINLIPPQITWLNIVSNLLSFLLLFIGVARAYTNEFKTLNFQEIYDKIKSIKKFKDFRVNYKLSDFSKILINKEDRSYFARKNSYNWFSFEFLLYRVKRIYSRSKQNNLSECKYIGKVLIIIIFIFNLFKETFCLLITIIKRSIKIFYKVFLRRKNIRHYLRGYSTIEMQLIRTLAVVDGYASHTLQRKAYEFVYSKIFFGSLKSFYEYHHYINLTQYKYYLIYLYIMVAPIKLNGKLYNSILTLYNKENINQVSIEEFYIWTLGLSHHIIDDSIMEHSVINIFRMDKKKLKELIGNYNN